MYTQEGGRQILMGEIPTFSSFSCGHISLEDQKMRSRCSVSVTQVPSFKPSLILEQAVVTSALKTYNLYCFPHIYYTGNSSILSGICSPQPSLCILLPLFQPEVPWSKHEFGLLLRTIWPRSISPHLLIPLYSLCLVRHMPTFAGRRKDTLVHRFHETSFWN
jgi:hypothetical protein